MLGQINFLTDPSTQPFMTTADLCSRFGVGQSTASAKARVISRALDASRLNPEWSLPSLLDQNPLVWMAEVNGLLVDLRSMPRENGSGRIGPISLEAKQTGEAVREIRMLRSTRRRLEPWHGRDDVTLADERASQRGTQTSA